MALVVQEVQYYQDLRQVPGKQTGKTGYMSEHLQNNRIIEITKLGLVSFVLLSFLKGRLVQEFQIAHPLPTNKKHKLKGMVM